MELHLKQWRDQHHHESEQLTSAKIPKLFLEPHPSETETALPLFVPITKLSDSTTRLASNMGSLFSLSQRQELELQALIYRYMLAGAAVPLELLQLIKRSIQHHHYSPYFVPSASASACVGYWGRAAMDPEPGRCRRTDGKKWRCSRDVVTGHKYCERHMHRGRNRSRKPVEIPTTSSPSIDLIHFNQSSPTRCQSDAHVLRHFFDDSPNTAPASLSISMTRNSSDVSLKLSTGIGEEDHATGWTTASNQVASMGGPLAEALRPSSNSNFQFLAQHSSASLDFGFGGETKT